MPTLACQPFATVDDVLSAPCGCAYTELDDGLLIQDLIDEASDFLYVASGGRVHGVCQRTVWPLSSRACGPFRNDMDYPVGWVISDAIPLAGPNTTIIQVKIDGVALDPSEYALYNGSYLFRRDGGWPGSNDITKLASEEGTFTVEFSFGEPVSRVTTMATVELVCQMMKDPLVLSRLRGITSANVQGVSVSTQAADEAESLGIPAIGRFLDRYAPRGMAALGVWSYELDNGWTLVSVGT